MRERVAKRYFADRRKDFRSLPIPIPPPPPPPIAVDLLWTGIPTATTASCSVKTASAADTVRMVVSTSSDLSSPIIGDPVTPDATFRLGKPSITGLTPNTQYYYAVSVNGVVDTTKKGQFRTPASGAHSFSFAFGSCSINTGVDQLAAFTAIKARNPAFFMHLGDFWYDTLGATYGVALAESHYQAVYDRELAARGDFHYAIPNCYNWSEHDYIDNEAGGRNADGSPVSKRQVPIDAFRRRVPVPLGSATQSDPVYYSFVYGRCRFVVLDTEADYQWVGPLDSSAGNTCLGPTQKAWLKAEVDAAAAAGQVIFLATENAWKSDNPGSSGSATNWMGFIAERVELTDYFVSKGMAGKIIILAGDTHTVMVGSSDYSTAGKTNKQPNFQAAPLNQGRSNKGGPWDTVPFPTTSVGQYQQYGMVDVVDTGSAITVTFTGYNAQGSTILLPVTVNMSARKIPPDFYTTATRAVVAPGTSLAAVPVPANTGLNGLRVAVVQSRNNDAHTCPTSGWVKLRQDNSGANFSASIWIAPETAASPTFNWTNSADGYARIFSIASSTGAMFQGAKGSSAISGTGATPGGAALANSEQDTLILALVSQAVQHSLSTNFWTRFSDVGSGTSGTELTIAGRRMTAKDCQMADLAFTAGGSVEWVLQQVELAVA